MLMDKLNRQFKEGQKVIFNHPGGLLEGTVEKVSEIAIANGNQPPMKKLTVSMKFHFNLPPEAVAIPDIYIVKEAEVESKLSLQ